MGDRQLMPDDRGPAMGNWQWMTGNRGPAICGRRRWPPSPLLSVPPHFRITAFPHYCTFTLPHAHGDRDRVCAVHAHQLRQRRCHGRSEAQRAEQQVQHNLRGVEVWMDEGGCGLECMGARLERLDCSYLEEEFPVPYPLPPSPSSPPPGTHQLPP
eukprot:357255-Chlamydomonas_euryale.AAC.3